MLFWVFVGFFSFTLLSLNEDLTTYMSGLDGTQEPFERKDWLIADRLSPEVLKVATFAGMDKRVNYPETFYQVFVPEKTRLELGIQNALELGVSREPDSAEFACLVFGCRYESRIMKMANTGALSKDRATQLVIEASAFAKGKKFWNCRDTCEH